MHFDTTILLKLQNQCHFFKRITEITVTKHIWKIQKYGYLIMIRARGQWSWMMVGSDLNLIKWYLQVWLLFQTWPFSGKKKSHDLWHVGLFFFLYNNKEHLNRFRWQSTQSFSDPLLQFYWQRYLPLHHSGTIIV